MTQFNRQNRSNAAGGILLPLGLICLFAFCSLLLAILGTRAYSSVQQSIDNDFGATVTANYLRTKLGRANAQNAVEIRQIEGVQVLAIATQAGGMQFETRIYVYEGQLMEDYVDADAPLRQPGAPGSVVIAQVQSCHFEITPDHLLTVDIVSHGNAKSRLVFALLEGGGP